MLHTRIAAFMLAALVAFAPFAPCWADCDCCAAAIAESPQVAVAVPAASHCHPDPAEAESTEPNPQTGSAWNAHDTACACSKMSQAARAPEFLSVKSTCGFSSATDVTDMYSDDAAPAFASVTGSLKSTQEFGPPLYLRCSSLRI